jgi:F-type H+-transporting ATPase subunit gamma
MATQTKAIKQRIRSVRNTKKITKAMELVAASKVRRNVSKTIHARPYIKYSSTILSSIITTNSSHPLLEQNTATKTLLVVITSNKGLCGAYNAQVIRTALEVLKENDCDVVTIGKKGESSLKRIKVPLIASFILGESIALREALPIAEFLIKNYSDNKYGKVLVVYTHYLSGLVQTATVKQLLPFKQDPIETSVQEYTLEPDKETVFNTLVEKIIKTTFYSLLLESHASEESARMLAMKNASEAAGEMIDDLTLSFNKIRQAGITQEISEISAGMTSIN